MLYYTINYESPVGRLNIASDGKNIVGLWIVGQKYFRDTIKGDIQEKPDQPELLAAKEWLNRYFAGSKPEISELPLAPIGSEFRQEVWSILCEIPYGKVITYGDIAKKMAAKMNKEHMSGQAVGGAVGHNPVSIIIPCHRVVGSNGSLTGFAGGITKKIQLLKHEGVDISKLYFPKKGTAL